MAKRDGDATGDGDGKKNTSLRLSKKTLKALKMRAIEEDTSVQRIIEQLIEAYLEASRKKGQ